MSNKLSILLYAFLLIGMLFTACHSHPKAEQGDYAYTAAYICPMHCAGSGAEEPGTCPVCKMDYEKNEDYEEEGNQKDAHEHDGHNHEGDHDNHEHDHDGHDH